MTHKVWVVEYIPEPGMYATIEHFSNGGSWHGLTRDIRKAIQYCRRIDAERGGFCVSNKEDFRAIEVAIGKGGRRVPVEAALRAA